MGLQMGNCQSLRKVEGDSMKTELKISISNPYKVCIQYLDGTVLELSAMTI